MTIRWEVDSLNGPCIITALDYYRFSTDDSPTVVIGREDGIIELYSIEPDGPPQLKAQHPLFQREHLRSNFWTASFRNPWFTSPWTNVHCLQGGTDFSGGSFEVRLSLDVYSSLRLLKEIEELQFKVKTQREKYVKSMKERNGVSSVPLFPIHDRFLLNKSDATHQLIIELPVPIECIVLQSEVAIDLLDVKENSAIVSFSPCDPQYSNALLATFRCQAETISFETKIRTIEGQYGTLQAYVFPRLIPAVCQVRRYAIKPLSLHHRTYSYDESRPQNVMKITGSFSLLEAHALIDVCLPEIPEKPPNTQTLQYYFTSSFVGSQLECTYS
ncbi:unnamed protein product [Soboliphyme baturini]|uniref:Protein PTHB1 n=1 Tax=Soboliphyme baturini TaxID=241478 RepID=A0A183J7J9_9BILA|nr:unnamed protein product [Soboliphyme baturini]